MKTLRSTLSRAHRARRKMAAVGALAAGAAMVTASQALAVTTPYDLAPAGDSITGQISAVLLIVLPIAGGILALFIGWKILKRFVAA